MAIYTAASVVPVLLILSLCVSNEQHTEATAVDSQSNMQVLSASKESTMRKGSEPKFVVCYFSNWAKSRQGVAKFVVADINPDICSHIIYAFVNLNNETLTMVPSSLYHETEQNRYERIVYLKKKNEKLKVLLSLGGWADSEGDKYSRMVSEPKSRRKFVKEAVTFLKTYKFDGLDLDWEFPVCWQADCSSANPNDKENFVYLTQDLREAFDEESPKLTLTVALSGSQYFAEKSYQMARLAKYVDFFNVLSYNMHGSWEKVTGHSSEMYGHSSSDIGDHSVVSVMEYYVRKGSPPEKLMMGIPLFGRSFTLMNPNNHGIGAPVRGPGKPGLYTKEPGLLAYNEVCDLIKNSNWIVQRDHLAGPYAFHDDQWVGYDDPISAKMKALLILEKGYGGAVVWDLSLDDFRGLCNMRTFPIVRELINNLQPDTTEAIGSSTTINTFKQTILCLATFLILQEHKNFY